MAVATIVIIAYGYCRNNVHKQELQAMSIQIEEKEYGDRYLNLREYLSTKGLEDAEISPTDEDIKYINSGSVPQSLRVDGVHLNKIGYKLIGNVIYERMIQAINNAQYIAYAIVNLPSTKSCRVGVTVSGMDTEITNNFSLFVNKAYVIPMDVINEDVVKSINFYTGLLNIIKNSRQVNRNYRQYAFIWRMYKILNHWINY